MCQEAVGHPQALIDQHPISIRAVRSMHATADCEAHATRSKGICFHETGISVGVSDELSKVRKLRRGLYR